VEEGPETAARGRGRDSQALRAAAPFPARVDSIASGGAEGGAELAASFGYFDQSHWNREFREFAGMTPSEYRPRAPGDPAHSVKAE
jgi:hypothetical protein